MATGYRVVPRLLSRFRQLAGLARVAAELELADKVVAVHQGMAAADVAHAFGGAIALAYYAEPRVTIDVDLNVFVPPENHALVEAVLEDLGIAASLRAVERDGQERVMWGLTPLDLFFSYLPFHDAMRDAASEVPFGSATIPILSAEHLVVCKALFDRPKDWLDIEQVATGVPDLDIAEVLHWVRDIVGETDPRHTRLRAVLGKGSG